MNRIKNRLNNHLKEINESYFEHMIHALKASLKLSIASKACFIHAIAPFLFEKTATNLCKKILKSRDKDSE